VARVDAEHFGQLASCALSFSALQMACGLDDDQVHLAMPLRNGPLGPPDEPPGFGVTAIEEQDLRQHMDGLLVVPAAQELLAPLE
jgi:hypothetical protein